EIGLGAAVEIGLAVGAADAVVGGDAGGNVHRDGDVLRRIGGAAAFGVEGTVERRVADRRGGAQAVGEGGDEIGGECGDGGRARAGGVPGPEVGGAVAVEVAGIDRVVA